MARAIALVVQTPAPSLEVLRQTLVLGCALALILAGPALPTLSL